MKFSKIPLILALAGCISSCDSANVVDAQNYSASEQAIINGTLVSGDEYKSTVALIQYGQYAFCTGTLISPSWVLTAGHCIYHCTDDQPANYIENRRPYMTVGVGNYERNVTQYQIDQFVLHPGFYCSPSKIVNDIALLHLKTEIPRYTVTPTQPMPPLHDFSAADVGRGVTVTTVGFGKTNYYNEYSSGTKYKTSYQVYAYCPLDTSRKSSNCGRSYTKEYGFIYVNDSRSNTCQGDSGGPTFYNKDGMDFVVGVTSYGYGHCDNVSAMTHVSSYYDSFITKYVTDLASTEPEICDNGIDDNNDGRIDCLDPWCFSEPQCFPENCENGLDDNANGFTDCSDPECKDLRICQPEICNNDIDDNDNGLSDCEDPQCRDYPKCLPEICDNHIDDNGSGLIDCEDPECYLFISCRAEDCFNGKDDNGNGFTDCEDPECAVKAVCKAENCSNGIDDNDNGLIDCEELSCANAPSCKQENCTNGVDDNANGLTDCADPQCIAAPSCQKEICDDQIDNNGNGLVDCNDPECTEKCAENSGTSSDSGCSAAPFQNASSPLWLILASLGLFRLRKRRSL